MKRICLYSAGREGREPYGAADGRLRKRFAGVSFSYSQNIEDDIDEALSGVKAGSNVVKVFGRDLYADESTANKIADVLNQVRGVTDVFVFRSLG